MKALCCFWDSETLQCVERFIDEANASVFEATSVLQELPAATYKLQSIRGVSTGIVFHSCEKSEYADFSAALEIDGFPIEGSLRVHGLDTVFTQHGVERARLAHMYRTGKDTSAVTALLMHGAHQLGLAGFGHRVLPVWCNEDQKSLLLRDLCLAAKPTVGHSAVVLPDALANRFTLPVLGAIATRSPKKWVDVPKGSDIPIDQCRYRLTLCWTAPRHAVGFSSVAEWVVSEADAVSCLSLEWIELYGPDLPPSLKTINVVSDFSLTLFLAVPAGTEPLRDQRADVLHVSVDGSELVGLSSIAESYYRPYVPKRTFRRFQSVLESPSLP